MFHRPILLICALAVACGSGCGTLKRMAVRSMSDAFSGDAAAEVFASDDDPELIRYALPFGLKTSEMLLKKDPSNRELYLSVASGYVQYAHVFVFQEALKLDRVDFEKARELRARARKLYLRGRNYAFEGLSLGHPDFEKNLAADSAKALAKCGKKDVPFLFWAGAGWAGAIACDVGDMEKVGELPAVEAMMRCILELDEGFQDGAVHEFFISYEASHGGMQAGAFERAQDHFERAVELSKGKKASPYVSLAESVAVKKQDLALFKDMLGQALAVDAEAVPAWRLANVIAQDRARWLLTQIPDLFVESEEAKP